MANNISNTVRKLSEQIANYANTVYPGMAGKLSLRFIDDNFRKQSWEGIPWKKRSAGAKRNQGRALLIDRGILRRGNRMQTFSGKVRIFNEVPYAKAHNEGFTGMVSISAHERKLYGKYKQTSLTTRKTTTKKTYKGTASVKAHSRNMRIPRRQFAPTTTRPSATLNDLVLRQVKLDMLKILKNKL